MNSSGVIKAFEAGREALINFKDRTAPEDLTDIEKENWYAGYDEAQEELDDSL